MTRVSGNNKLFLMDLETQDRRQLTFGTHDDSSPQFLDENRIMFISTATDPNEPVTPEVAKDGQIFNIWTLDLRNGELKRLTNALSGILSPVALRDNDGTRVAFITFHKGEYGIHAVNEGPPTLTAVSSDFGGPGPIIDFQAPLQHTLLPDNQRKKGTFEKMFLDGRPPLNVGITSGGDLFGGTSLTFSDVLGDRQFNMFIESIAQYQTFAGSYVDLSRRFQYAVQGYSQTQFFYGYQPGLLVDSYLTLLDRDYAVATRTSRGATLFGIYPINRHARLEVSGGIMHFHEQYADPYFEELADSYQEALYGTPIFRDGTFVPVGVSFVQETTVFRPFGPLAGNTVRLRYEIAPKIGNTLSRQTADVDARYYLRLGTNGVLALRGRGFLSWGDAPDFTYFGGNSELRGYDYLEFLGHKAFFLNAELRFPLIEAMLTPIGVMGGIRGVFYFGLGAACISGAPCDVFESSGQQYPPILDYVPDPDEEGAFVPVYGEPIKVSGFRLKDGRASYGIGLETFALGFPIHFDWSWRTLFNRAWEDVAYAAQGGSSSFRKARFAVWMGYDF
jgi:hypothetical protein